MAETEQNLYTIEIKKKLSAYEIEAIFGTTNIGILDCSGIPDEEVDRIVDKWNSIPEEYIIPIKE